MNYASNLQFIFKKFLTISKVVCVSFDYTTKIDIIIYIRKYLYIYFAIIFKIIFEAITIDYTNDICIKYVSVPKMYKSI